MMFVNALTINALTQASYLLVHVRIPSSARAVVRNGETSPITLNLKRYLNSLQTFFSSIQSLSPLYMPCFSKSPVLDAVYLFRRMEDASTWCAGNANMNSVGCAYLLTILIHIQKTNSAPHDSSQLLAQ